MIAVPFSLGAKVITPMAEEWVAEEDIARILQRHQNGDFGDVSENDKCLNKEALEEDTGRVFSAYQIGAMRVWVITEGLEPDQANDRYTTVLLPEEY